MDGEAAEAVVQQEADHHVLETRHQGLNRRYHCENGFRESQPVDSPHSDCHHSMPLKNGGFFY